MSAKTISNLVIAVLVLVGLFAGYKVFTRSADPTAPATDLESIAVTAAIAGDQGGEAELSSDLALLESLKAIQLNDDLFRNPIFANVLFDFSRPLPDREAGRFNPFLPPEVAPFGTTRTTAVATSSGRSNATSSDFQNIAPPPLSGAQ